MLRLRGGCGEISPEANRGSNEDTEIVIQESPEHIDIEDSEEEESPEMSMMVTQEDLAVQETPDDVVMIGSYESTIVDQDQRVDIEEFSERLFEKENVDDTIEEYSESMFVHQNPDVVIEQYSDSISDHQKHDAGHQQTSLNEHIVRSPEKIIIDESSSEEGPECKTIPEAHIGDEDIEVQEALNPGDKDSQKSTRIQHDLQDFGKESTDVDSSYNNFGFKFLRKIDEHFCESPRLLMRGIWRSDELELQVKRKTEGVLVQWLLTNTRSKKIVVNAMAQMTYKPCLSLSNQYGSAFRQYGYAVEGGWGWDGFGYGFVNLNRIHANQQNLIPLSDSSIKHLDLEEAVFPNESVFHHISGVHCKKSEENKKTYCKEEGCGIEISKLTIQSFSTIVDKPDSWELVHNLKRHEFKEQVSFSLVVFPSSGEHKVLLQVDEIQKSLREVAWMAKASDHFDDAPGVDKCKIEKHQYIWRTGCPKKVLRESSTSSKEHKQYKQQKKCKTTGCIEEIPPAAEINPLYDLSRALRESRKAMPNGMTQKEMVELGIKFMDRLGVQCQQPTSFVTGDGDCLWSSIVRFQPSFTLFVAMIHCKTHLVILFILTRSRNRHLKGEDLRREAFHTRLVCVGSAIEAMKGMDQESLAVIQSVVAVVRREQGGREYIISEMNKYLGSGTYTGIF